MSYVSVSEQRSSSDRLAPLLDQARDLFEMFHRFEPDDVVTTKCRRSMPRVLVRLGKLRGLIYSSDRGERGRPRTFVHFFETPPALASDCRGEQIFVVGGHYRVTRKGIEG